MKKTVLLRLAGIGCMILLAALFAFAQEHKWAGRTLNDVEWRIHPVDKGYREKAANPSVRSHAISCCWMEGGSMQISS